MCLIIVKKPDIELPKKEWLLNAEKNNSDGIGVAYKKAGIDEVYIKKDFKDANTLTSWLDAKITKEDTLIIHFRLATHGLKDIGNRHPFPITQDRTLLRKPELICRYAVAHNGIISQFNMHKKFSDTQKFVLSILADENIKNNLDNKAVQILINNFIDRDKLAILRYDGTLYLFGEYSEDNGLLFSNQSYKEIKYYLSNLQYNFDNAYHSDDKNGLVDICDGCKQKKFTRYTEFEDNAYMLCKKCRKKIRKNQLTIDAKEPINQQCYNCFDFFESNQLVDTKYGKVCRKCSIEITKYLDY